MFSRIIGLIKKSIYLQSLIVSFVVLLVVYPDVVFKGTALSVTDNLVAARIGSSKVEFYPRFSYRDWWQSYSDNGGSYFQSEPMMEFMKNSFLKKESPYWNPYSGMGSMGPESLVDIKFSPQSLIYSLLGGGSKIFNFSLLLITYFAVFFIFLILRKIFKLSFLSSFFSCLFYLLCGFSSANVSSNIYQSFLLAPACLFFLLSIIDRVTVLRFIGLTVSIAMLFLCTFSPTMIVLVVTVLFISVFFYFYRNKNFELTGRRFRLMLLVLSISALFSFLLVSPVYLPIIENLKSSGILSMYSERIYIPANVGNILSLITPFHFYESYNAFSIFDTTRPDLAIPTIYHIGIVSFFVLFCSICSKKKNNFFAISLFLFILLILFRIFGFIIPSIILDKIPIIGKIGPQYWWPAFFLPLVILVGIGYENILENKIKLFNIYIPFILIIVSFLISSFVYAGGVTVFNKYKFVAILLDVFLLILSFSLLLFRSRKTHILFLVLMVIELIGFNKQIRYKSIDYYNNPSDEIIFLQKNSGLYRTLSFGGNSLVSDQGSGLSIYEMTSNNNGTVKDLIPFFKNVFNLSRDQYFNASYIFPSLLSIKDTPEINNINLELLNLSGVKYLVLPANYKNYFDYFLKNNYLVAFQNSYVNILENKNVYPRSFLIDSDNFNEISGEDDLEITDFSKISKVTDVEIVSYKNTEVILKGKSLTKSYLVLTDSWHDKWVATVNGRDVKIGKLNNMFRVIEIDPGDFTVTFTYKLKTIRYSLVFSGLTIIVLVFLGLFHKKIDIILSKLD